MSEASDRLTMIETIKKRLHENRRASEAIDAQELPEWPGLTADQCAAVDEMAGLCDEVKP